MASIKIRTKRLDGKTQIRVLISHPMENGRNRDKQTGELIPAHFIRELTIKHNDNYIVSGALGGSISKDPYFSFVLNGGAEQDKITVAWEDNLGNSESMDALIS